MLPQVPKFVLTLKELMFPTAPKGANVSKGAQTTNTTAKTAKTATPLTTTTTTLREQLIKALKSFVMVSCDNVPVNQTNTETICRDYSEGVYESMNMDTARNTQYRLAIQECNKHSLDTTATRCWLEIGCGASALLTKMVLAGTNSSVIAIEANEESAKKARKILKREITVSDDRWSIVTGYSLNKDVIAEVCKSKPNFVLHEIFGFFSSSEGAPVVIQSLKKDYSVVTRDAQFVPGKSATFFTPCCVESQHFKKQSMVSISGNKLILAHLNIKECRLSAVYRALEFYDFNAELQLKQENIHEFVVTRSGCLNALCCFIWVDFSQNVHRAGKCGEFPFGDTRYGTFGQLSS